MPQKKVRSKRGTEFRAPAPPRTHEKQLRELLAFMAEEIRERFRNNVLEEYNQTNFEKAEIGDAAPVPFQDANFARDFTRLANKVKQMIQQQFPNARLRREVEKIMQRANRDNRDRLYNSLERRIGVDRTELVKREGLQWQANARIEQVYEWVEKMRDETLEGFHRNTMQKLVEGRDIDEVIEEFENTANKRKNHVQYLARTQLANYNSQMTRLRAQRLGIQKAKWVTSEDERVRKCHAVRNGKEFDLEEGLYSSCDGKTLWPGSDHNCRCTYLLVIPGENEREQQQEEAEA
jgi:SPP1 gp7 family putative phage head morphogenesis protein